jgi:hypothetical protein
VILLEVGLSRPTKPLRKPKCRPASSAATGALTIRQRETLVVEDATARNTDGVDPVSESDVTIKDDMIQNGDDCVAVKSNAALASRNI